MYNFKIAQKNNNIKQNIDKNNKNDLYLGKQKGKTFNL